MRSEYKYLVPLTVLDELRDAIEPFVVPDPHGVGLERVGYTVRSTYLDTANLKYYEEKKAGLRVRRKLRVRAYGEARKGDWVFLEIKRKVDDKVAKNRAPILLRNFDALVRSGDVDGYVFTNRHYPKSHDDARRFLYHVYRYGLAPTILTVYEREAFLGRFDPTFRITFDRNLRGSAYGGVANLYDEDGMRKVHPGHFVLEVKYNTRFPTWLRTVLGRYSLRNEALSKYCLCAEATRHHLDTPVEVLASIVSVA